VRGETQTPRVSDPFFFDAFDAARTGRPATRDESRAIGRRLYDGVIATGKAEEVDALTEGSSRTPDGRRMDARTGNAWAIGRGAMPTASRCSL
jgi:hypothetical protein